MNLPLLRLNLLSLHIFYFTHKGHFRYTSLLYYISYQSVNQYLKINFCLKSHSFVLLFLPSLDKRDVVLFPHFLKKEANNVSFLLFLIVHYFQLLLLVVLLLALSYLHQLIQYQQELIHR